MFIFEEELDLNGGLSIGEDDIRLFGEFDNLDEVGDEL